MESILARALEYTLKYWLKSFSRDQFKLQGRTAQLSNLDINGDVLHASAGLPPALHVTKARVGKLEITLPSVSNVQFEPVIVQIDRLDLVLEENPDACDSKTTSCSQASNSSARGSGYGFSDKIADGMTLEVGIVNLLIETRGGPRGQGGATWLSPIASITMRNLLLYTTNENWQVVNLKEAREFSNKKKFIYVFKKLEWESLSVEILPHPDMFSEAYMMPHSNEGGERDKDGAKRIFFGGERFLEGISGYAHITIQRTEYNYPLGLEVQLHVTEAVCPSLSEPGLRALLRFMTGFYVCLNRGDIGNQEPRSYKEAAGRSLVSVIVDHIFVCIKDSEFQLELLMQSLYFSRASISDGEITKNLSRIMVGGVFLRDAFSHPPCTLIQPSVKPNVKDHPPIPEFAENFCPPIYPLGDADYPYSFAAPLICIHSLQANPPLAPPLFASQTIIDCLPLMITLQEESCLRIASFLADGVVISLGSVLPDSSINSTLFTLREFVLIVPLNGGKTSDLIYDKAFSGARLHVESLIFSQSPSLKCELLNLERDPACFALWPGQPIDSSQKRWKTQVSHLSISLETLTDSMEKNTSSRNSPSLWTCVDLEKASFEAAMVTPDGSPLVDMPPPGGTVRIGMACQKYISNASVDQLFFILDLYTYFGKVSDEILTIGKSSKQRRKSELSLEKLLEKVPCDAAVNLSVTDLQLKFLDSSSSLDSQGMPLVKFSGEDLFVKVSHQTLGGAFAMSTNLHWGSIRVDCTDTDEFLSHQTLNGYPNMRSVLWINNNHKDRFLGSFPFMEVNAVHVMPYNVKDSECHSLNVIAKVSGVRLGGGMSYTEALLHRFGVIGPDGGPGDGLIRGLERLSSGPLAKLLRASPLAESSQRKSEYWNDEQSTGFLELGKPDDIDISLEMKDWLFALEGLREAAEEPLTFKYNGIKREERHWHGTFQSIRIYAKSSSNTFGTLCRSNKYPLESLVVSMEGLKALKPLSTSSPADSFDPFNLGSLSGGMNLEVNIVISEEEQEEMNQWMVEKLTFSVKEPVEVVITKDEVDHLVNLCREEIDSVGRITAGILRLLKLDESVGPATLKQLSNLGRESVDKIFSPERPSRSQSQKMVATGTVSEVFSLETVLSDSQAKCSALVAEMTGPEFPPHILQEIKQLNQKLENMQVLLTRLKKSTHL